LNLDEQKERDLFSRFGKTEKPFTNEILVFKGKSKVYKLKNIPVRILAEKHKEY